MTFMHGLIVKSMPVFFIQQLTASTAAESEGNFNGLEDSGSSGSTQRA